jgi:hypothetical protein
MSVGVEDCFCVVLVVDLLALLLLVSLMPLGYVMWWWKCVEQQWLFELFLLCLCSYPGFSADGAARVLAW